MNCYLNKYCQKMEKSQKLEFCPKCRYYFKIKYSYKIDNELCEFLHTDCTRSSKEYCMKMLNNLVVFIVDDDQFCQALYRQYLMNIGYRNVHTFDKGPNCLDMLNLSPDIIFVDFNMDPYNGLELLNMIKSINPAIYILMISAQKDIHVALEAIELGAFDYIVKEDGVFKMINESINKIFQSIAKLRECYNCNLNI